MLLRPVDPIGVYNRWDWFRAGIQKAIDRTGAHMRPEDVYLRVRTGTAWAYVIEADEDIGFIVTTVEHDPDGAVMFIWCLWCERGKLNQHKAAFYEALDGLAGSINAKRVRGWSPRKGYQWFDYVKPVATIYERELGG